MFADESRWTRCSGKKLAKMTISGRYGKVIYCQLTTPSEQLITRLDKVCQAGLLFEHGR